MSKETKEQAETEQDTSFKKQNAISMIVEAAWKVSFIRDVAYCRALYADKEHVGITSDGEQGLGLILEDIAKDLNNAIDLF